MLAHIHINVSFYRADNKSRTPDLNFFSDTHLNEQDKVSQTQGGRIVDNQFFYGANKHFLLKAFNLMPKAITSTETIISLLDFNNASCKAWVESSTSSVKPRVLWIKIYNTDENFLIIQDFNNSIANGEVVSQRKLVSKNIWQKYPVD